MSWVILVFWFLYYSYKNIFLFRNVWPLALFLNYRTTNHFYDVISFNCRFARIFIINLQKYSIDTFAQITEPFFLQHTQKIPKCQIYMLLSILVHFKSLFYLEYHKLVTNINGWLTNERCWLSIEVIPHTQ